MNSGHRNSLHHLYYSSHADPSDSNVLTKSSNLKSKSSYQLNQFPLSKQYGSRWTIAQPSNREQMEARQEKMHNTYYNNMMCYINYKQNDTDSSISTSRRLGKSMESLNAKRIEGPKITELSKSEEEDDCAACTQCDSCCRSGCRVFCFMLVGMICLAVGFLVGVVVGAVIQRDGYLEQVGFGSQEGYYGSGKNLQGGSDDPSRCIVRMAQPNITTNCSVCSHSRVLNVTGAGYADCDGLYTISNLTSIWDSKQVVYERISGGYGPETRFIYWNAHYYGEDFYGWSIGDSKSLYEDGPFHSQGRAGASNLPWRGSWRGNVTIQLSACQIPVNKIRFGPMNMYERERERERELNRLRNMQRNGNMFDGQ